MPPTIQPNYPPTTNERASASKHKQPASKLKYQYLGCQPFVTVIPILLTSKPKVNQALFMACLRCIRCCKTFILVLINTLGHSIASYFATIVSHEVARGPSCHRTLTLSSSVSLSTNLALIVQTLFMACLRCIRCCKTFIVNFINTLGHLLCCIIF